VINIFWFRRDLRLDDNTAFSEALSTNLQVLPVFIFDTEITDELPADDPRITFIYETLRNLNERLNEYGGSILILKGDVRTAWEKLTDSYEIDSVYFNKDYEPYAIDRDRMIGEFLSKRGIRFFSFKDQVIFEEKEIVKADNNPLTIFTPYKNRWLRRLTEILPMKKSVFQPGEKSFPGITSFPSAGELGFRISSTRVRNYSTEVIIDYHRYRDFPAEDRTSYLGPHLRFGTVSIRSIAELAIEQNEIFLGELIWREFFMQIIFSFPGVVTENFRSGYDNIRWRNDEKEFARWCNGETGYPIVDAGMRQLLETGYMHNRVRMITAGFLCKHLLIDWRWGEAYFASKLLDYELSSNNGNWQWAAGTGCDAVPYFRIFNPSLQQARFDKDDGYIKKWLPEAGGNIYPSPIVGHEYARQRAILAYKAAISI
jgi:deoxyribodipyrimidine photo-lyase